MDVLLSRDPSGFVFKHNKEIYRAVNKAYRQNYDHLIQSGLFKKLCSEELLIKHQELDDNKLNFDCYKIIKPVQIDFISYPYEWSFEQLKDAAITTLTIQKIALDYKMSLKDASAYNVQFMDSKPVFIDTLSFEIYKEGFPWIAYKQFCQHFLAPLLLMAYKDLRLQKLLNNFMDGIPLDLTNSLLPFKCLIDPKILLHITLHSKAQKKFSAKKADLKEGGFSKNSFYRLIDNLLSSVKSIKLKNINSHWINYYNGDNSNPEYINHKKELISLFLDRIKPGTLWDLGSNTGVFSKIASEKNIRVICFDSDPVIVNKVYVDCKSRNEKNILPLVMDLVNPSSASGWAESEHKSLTERASAEIVMALALVHHLAITNNIPLRSIAEYFANLSGKLLIEFIPKDDANTQILLRSREDIFSDYNQLNFENEFNKFFTIIAKEKINSSERVLYLMERN